jgi:hypothetical protein
MLADKVTREQLKYVKSLKEATLPNGMVLGNVAIIE